jgi:hypothetical protein
MNTSEGQQISVEEEQEPLEGKGKEPERPKANLKRPGRHKDDIWSYFEEKGERNRGHCGAICIFCNWEQKVGQINDMKGHLALSCKNVPQDVKKDYLDIVKNTQTKKLKTENQNQPKIYEKFEPVKIDTTKMEMANRAIIKFFACCGIPFHIVENPFFIDLLRILCPGYFPPSRQTLSVTMLNTEVAHIVCETNNMLEKESNLTLGGFIKSFFKVINIMITNILIYCMFRLRWMDKPQWTIALRLHYNYYGKERICTFSSKLFRKISYW